MKFQDDDDLDEHIYQHFEDEPSYIVHKKLIANRIAILGQKRYLQMLRGKAFLEKELVFLANKHKINVETLKKVLELNTSYLTI
jgi:hypothetical protein